MTTALDPQPATPAPTGGVPFYTEKGKAQPRAVKGRFRTLKWWATAILLGWWHLAPFIRWDRGPGAPGQGILIDMVGRRAYFFMIEIWPQEVYYLTGLLLIAAISLFLMSSLAGRVWCGFLCWQTVYTDLFVWVEEHMIGDRNARIAFTKQPLSLGKIGRLAAVNVIWLGIAFLCGLSFTLYFGDAFQVLHDVFTLQAPLATYLFIGVIGGFCYLLAGHARERVCVYMCPYSRFQMAMTDEHSLVVSYEAWRGEPRGHVKHGESFEGRGHCVDCQLCLHVCPTGIDIRRGPQLACIGCGLCVDACNTVMAKFGLPANLISYDSSANMVARGRGLPATTNLIRPRTVLYAGVLAVAGCAMLASLALRSDLRVDVLHGRTPVAVQLSGGMVRNGYDYKILNMQRHDRQFILTAGAIPGGATLDVVGGTTNAQAVPLTVAGDSVGSFRLYVTTTGTEDRKNRPLNLVLTEPATGKTVVSETFVASPDE